jgi:hypothetical protein
MNVTGACGDFPECGSSAIRLVTKGISSGDKTAKSRSAERGSFSALLGRVREPREVRLRFFRLD